MSKTIRIAVALLFFTVGAAFAYPAMLAKGGVSLNEPVFLAGLFLSVSGIVFVFSPRFGGALGSLALVCLAGVVIPQMFEATDKVPGIGLFTWVVGLLLVTCGLLVLYNRRSRS